MPLSKKEKNGNALQSFLDNIQKKGNNGNTCWFDVDLSYTAKKDNRTYCYPNIEIFVNIDHKYQCKNIKINGDINDDTMFSEFSTTFNEWSFENGNLVIRGKDKTKTKGDYIVIFYNPLASEKQNTAISSEQIESNENSIISFTEKTKTLRQSGLETHYTLKYTNLSKNTERKYHYVSICYYVLEKCLYIPTLKRKRYRFSEFDLSKCTIQLNDNTLVIDGKDLTYSGKGDYHIEISRSHNLNNL